MLSNSSMVMRGEAHYNPFEVKLATTVNRVRFEIDLPGVAEDEFTRCGNVLGELLRSAAVKNRDAITQAFLEILRACPQANPSDLWHHVVYRQYCDVLPLHRQQDPKQSWVRASGEALEQVVETLYAPVLRPHGVEIRALISRARKRDALMAMGLGAEVGDSKLDVALCMTAEGGSKIFGGVHVKASLAERVSDDVPASRAMMRRGLLSPLWTLDVKSFPPPRGDLVNRGELGSPRSPSEKRKYIEEHGDFDNCYSANSRSVPSTGAARSGKRIYTLKLSQQPDKFAADVLACAGRRS